MAPPRPGLCGAQGQALGCGAAQLQHPQLHHDPIVLRWGWQGQQAGQGWHGRGSTWHHPRQGQGGSPPAGVAHARLRSCSPARLLVRHSSTGGRWPALLPAGRLLCGAVRRLEWQGVRLLVSAQPAPCRCVLRKAVQTCSHQRISTACMVHTVFLPQSACGPQAAARPSSAPPLLVPSHTQPKPGCCGQGLRTDPSSSPSARGSTSVSLSTADASPMIPQPGAQPWQHSQARQAGLPGLSKPVPHPALALQQGQLSGLLRQHFQALQDPGPRETRTPSPLGFGKGPPLHVAPRVREAPVPPAARPMLHSSSQRDRGEGRLAEATELPGSAAGLSQGPYRPNGPMMYKSRHEKFMGSMRAQSEQ